MGICKVDQFDQNESFKCIIFDRSKDDRFKKFNFPIASNGKLFTLYLSKYEPSVVVANTVGLNRSDIKRLIDSDNRRQGEIVFVLLSHKDSSAAQILQQKLAAVRKLKSDCSHNNLEHSIQYSFRWGPSGFLKKGRIASNHNNTEERENDLLDDTEIEQINDLEHEPEKKQNHVFGIQSRIRKIAGAALAFPIAIFSGIFIINPCFYSSDVSCSHFSISNAFAQSEILSQQDDAPTRNERESITLNVDNANASKLDKIITADNSQVTSDNSVKKEASTLSEAKNRSNAKNNHSVTRDKIDIKIEQKAEKVKKETVKQPSDTSQNLNQSGKKVSKETTKVVGKEMTKIVATKIEPLRNIAKDILNNFGQAEESKELTQLNTEKTVQGTPKGQPSKAQINSKDNIVQSSMIQGFTPATGRMPIHGLPVSSNFSIKD